MVTPHSGELTTIVSEPSIVHVMERLRGSGESNDPATIAKLLMSRYDRNHNDALDSNEVETMKRELQELTRAPFSVFLSQATPTAGANMQGVVVLDCSTPLLAERCTNTCFAAVACKHLTSPVLALQCHCHLASNVDCEVHAASDSAPIKG